jgi:tetratricopeptide (TPR) repeat protein
MGEDMKITAQLIEPAHDNHIWLRDYELPYSEVPGIPGEIARQIADHLKIFLTDNELKNIETKPTENIEAFNLYMQGRYFLSQSGKASLDKSITYYNEALSIDPNYALAYSGKAATFIAYATKGYLPRKDVLPLAKQAAMKAIELDSELGEAHAVLAQARVVQDWDWIRGEKGFQRALELNPNNVSAYFYYSWLLTDLERHDEAILKSKRAHELDPLSADVWVNYARRYYFARQFKRAIEEFHKIIDVFPENAYARIELALALAQNGNYIEALEECRKLELLPQPSWKIGVIYGIIGEEEKANEILDHYLERSENEFVWHASIFFIYAALNNKDAAFEWIEKTYEEREAWLVLLQAEPMYDNIRSDPRFQDLVERMNFPH